MKVSNLIKLSVVLWSDLKPDWNRDMWLFDSKNHDQVFYKVNLSELYVYNNLAMQDLCQV